jgi:hypothetical protein
LFLRVLNRMMCTFLFQFEIEVSATAWLTGQASPIRDKTASRPPRIAFV